MSRNEKTSTTAALLLVVLGILALVAGEKSLILLMPVATMVWYKVAPKLRRGRN